MHKPKYSNKYVLIFSSFCFVIGVIGLLLFGLQISGYIFAHIGALGLLGFFGIATAYLANKKGYSEKLAFNLAFSFAILAGLLESILVFLFGENGHFVCGGTASLITVLIVLLAYMSIRQKLTIKNDGF